MFLGTLILVVSILELKNLGANESFATIWRTNSGTRNHHQTN